VWISYNFNYGCWNIMILYFDSIIHYVPYNILHISCKTDMNSGLQQFFLVAQHWEIGVHIYTKHSTCTSQSNTTGK